MTAQEIQTFCIAASNAYLKFLVDNNHGYKVIHVSRIEKIGPSANRIFKLTLGGRLFNPDSVCLQVTPPNIIYEPDSFRVVEYDGDTRILIVQVVSDDLHLEAVLANYLNVISDLRFLVKNVRRWFETNGLHLELPNKPATHLNIKPIGDMNLEPCQWDAVKCSLENPLTYIWGPPGTGKTKHVLAQAVLHSGKRVGIFAPTNNALEQAMEAVLNVAEGIGINRDKFLRVGHPSAKFAHKFPEICEVRGLELRITEQKKQINNYKMVLEHRRGATVLDSVAILQLEIDNLQGLLVQRRSLYEEIAEMKSNILSRAIHFFDGKLQALNDNLSQLEKQIKGKLEMIKRTQTNSPLLNRIIERINFTNIDQIEQDMNNLGNATRQTLANYQALADSYVNQPDEKIQRLIRDAEQQIETLITQTIQERIKSVWVMGMTLDCFIGRFHDTLLPFDHIFVDEAGYAPLIKALTLCRKGIPLTFIGDHKQLGPVCEMNDENMNVPENNLAIVWKKSALFIDELFHAESQDTLVMQLVSHNEPKLQSFTRASLNKTFRFGQNLADLLSSYVYKGVNLVSAEHCQELEIICLNAVCNISPENKHESLTEVTVIGEHLRQYKNLYVDKEDTLAILTPYRNQVSLLKRSPNNLLVEARRQERIMTIHESQGREWDTVILSIVDGPSPLNCLWFADTTNPKSGGLYVMNTAISRARKRLVLVCDMDFWSNRGNQLISLLLNIGQRG